MWTEPSLLGALQGSSADKETNAREMVNQTFARGVRYRALTLIYTELIYCGLPHLNGITQNLQRV